LETPPTARLLSMRPGKFTTLGTRYAFLLSPSVAVSAFPAPHGIIENIRVQIGAVGPPALLSQVLTVGEQLGTAGRLGQQLHATGALELQCEPHRLLDAAAGGHNAVVAQNERRMIAQAPCDRLAAGRVDDEVGRLGEDRDTFAEDRAVVADRQ
jgi:hypothetical protein